MLLDFQDHLPEGERMKVLWKLAKEHLPITHFKLLEDEAFCLDEWSIPDEYYLLRTYFLELVSDYEINQYDYDI